MGTGCRSGARQKALQIVGEVLLYVVVILALFVLVVTIVSKKDDEGTATVFGYQLRFVQSDSMNENEATDVSDYKIKSFPAGTCVFVQVIPEADDDDAEAIQRRNEWLQNLKVGDVLTFKYYIGGKQDTITHRIISIQPNTNGGYSIKLRGDNVTGTGENDVQTIDTSATASYNYVIGKVTGKSLVLGWLVFAFKQPWGIVCFIIVPCLVVIIFEVLRLSRVFGSEKKEKMKAEQQRQADEIEELRRKLAALQGDVAEVDSSKDNLAAENQNVGRESVSDDIECNNESSADIAPQGGSNGSSAAESNIDFSSENTDVK